MRQPTLDQIVPSVVLIPLLLLGSCSLDQLRRVDPPDRPGPEPGNRLRPELVAIPRERIDVDRAASDRPEPAVSGLITEIGVRIDGPGEDAAPRHLNRVAAVGRSEAVGGAGEKSLDPGDLGLADGIELGDLDDPDALHVQCGVL